VSAPKRFSAPTPCQTWTTVVPGRCGATWTGRYALSTTLSVDRGEVAFEVADAGRGEHDAPADRQEVEEDAEDAEERRRERVLESGHPPQICWRTMMFWPSSVRSVSLTSIAITSATASGCMIVLGSSSGASLRRSSVAVRPGEIV
jgi:hypothetical protein